MLNLNDSQEGARLRARESIPGRWDNQGTGPELGLNLACSRSRDLGLWHNA